MVLDAVVDPSQGFQEFLLGQADAFEDSFATSVAGCAAVGVDRCGVEDLGAAYDRVRAAVERSPLRGGDEPVGPSALATAAIQSNYAADGWVELGPALAAALEGDGGPLWDLAASYYDFGRLHLLCSGGVHRHRAADGDGGVPGLCRRCPRACTTLRRLGGQRARSVRDLARRSGGRSGPGDRCGSTTDSGDRQHRRPGDAVPKRGRRGGVAGLRGAGHRRGGRPHGLSRTVRVPPRSWTSTSSRWRSPSRARSAAPDRPWDGRAPLPHDSTRPAGRGSGVEAGSS